MLGRRQALTVVSMVLAIPSLWACQFEVSDDDGSVRSAEQELLYGADDRVEYLSITSDVDKHVADGTVALTVAGALNCNSSNCSFSTGSYVNSNLTDSSGNPVPLCSSVRFRGQGTFPFCTGFLVGPQTIMTNAHCMRPSPGTVNSCTHQGDTVRFMFGFTANSSGQAPTSVPAGDVYTCSSAVGEWDSTQDWAVVTLDRIVDGRTPLTIDYTGDAVDVGTYMKIYGHGEALPLKMSDNVFVKVDDPADDGFFWGNADIFPGNSGGPTARAFDGVVAGISQGRPDADYIDLGGCAVLKSCNEVTGCTANPPPDIWTHHSRTSLAAQEGNVPLHTALIGDLVLL